MHNGQSTRPYLLIHDGNPPWVRAFAESLLPEADVVFLRVYAVHYYLRHLKGKLRDGWRREAVRDGVTDQWALIPGWSHAPKVSAAAVRWVIRRVIRERGMPAAVVHTAPWGGLLLDDVAEVPQFYLAHDVFRFYGWPAAQVHNLEQRLLDRCRATFVVARALTEEFSQRTANQVIYSPMATSERFVQALPDPTLPVPADLAALPRPIVGCTGQINNSYDWDLIERLAGFLPHVTFAFVGPIVEAPGPMRARIERVLSSANVNGLGAKPHAELPAYWQHCDVLFNPLAVTEHNDRRSPLRLFDYLCTDKPVLSTAIREASEHAGLVRIGRDAEACATHLRHMLAGRDPVDLPARRRYLEANNWRARGGQLLDLLPALRKASP